MPRRKSLDVEAIIRPDNLASTICQMFQTWDSMRAGKLEEWKELRDYLYATDTRTTSNGKLPWSNSTTTPKLAQIKDNLHANYFAALFPNDDWLRWYPGSKDDNTKNKAKFVESYMKQKLIASGFYNTVSKLLDDWIIYGNIFVMPEFVIEDTPNGESLERIVQYMGPKARRISPLDIVFDPTASDFRFTPKIVREYESLSTIKKLWPEVYERLITNRKEVVTKSKEYDTSKNRAYIADGFSSIDSYYSSSVVQLYHFYGDIFDQDTHEFRENQHIVVADNAYILHEETIDDWVGGGKIYHTCWRDRPDNLWGMGPLDNLVGLQYRIDHLENLKADVFDQIAFPTLKVRGEVEDFEYRPGEKIYMDTDSDVTYLVPDTTALNADFQIQRLMDIMEELVGAPREAMGLRSPGEKTAFEVQTLSTGANRIFQHYASKLEKELIEPLVNAMLAIGRKKMSGKETISVVNEDFGGVSFQDITREDIASTGMLIPVGARHFADQARRVQQLNQMLLVKAQLPDVGVHLSGKMAAQIMAEEIGESDLYRPNVAVMEQAETSKLVNETQVAENERQQIAQRTGI